MIPVPFSCNPGDKLRVTKNQPWGTDLVTGDLVTVEKATVKVEDGLPIPVVVVFTAHGRQILGLDAVEPYTPPTYTPAEPDDVTDAHLRSILAADPELLTLFTDADTALGAEEQKVADALGGGTTVAAPAEATVRHTVGGSYQWEDADGDEVDVTYYEQDCADHGRQGSFCVTINDDESVIIPADHIDGLIKYLFHFRNVSRRPPGTPGA